jgi:hypothetical protein
MPIPVAPHAAATAPAAGALTHRPTAATASNGTIGQSQGELAANRIRLSALTQYTYHPSRKTAGQVLALHRPDPLRTDPCWVSTFPVFRPKLGFVRPWEVSRGS